MIFDQQQPSSPYGGVVAFPDYPFAAKPVPDADLRETIIIGGSSATPGGSVGGTVDDSN